MLEQHFSLSSLPKETNCTSIHMKQSSDRLYSHTNLIIGAFLTIDTEKCDNKVKKIYEQDLTKKICETFVENVSMTILWKFAIIQAFTAPWMMKWDWMAAIFHEIFKCDINVKLNQISSYFLQFNRFHPTFHQIIQCWLNKTSLYNFTKLDTIPITFHVILKTFCPMQTPARDKSEW